MAKKEKRNDSSQEDPQRMGQIYAAHALQRGSLRPKEALWRLMGAKGVKLPLIDSPSAQGISAHPVSNAPWTTLIQEQVAASRKGFEFPVFVFGHVFQIEIEGNR